MSFCVLAGLMPACGGGDGSGATPLAVVGTVIIANAHEAGDNGTLSFDRATCTRDGNSGLFSATLSNASGLEGLKVQIRDFHTTTDNTYSCRQATDNKNADLGGQFDTCMVELKKKSLSKPTSSDTFAMYRDRVEIEPFDYQGTCQLVVSYAAPTVSAKASCTKLMKTYRADALMNPPDASATVDVITGSEFKCTI